MSKYKIISIIPADGWYAIYKQEDGSLLRVRVICLALIEYKDGERDVQALDYSDGCASLCQDAENFDGIVFEERNSQ